MCNIETLLCFNIDYILLSKRIYYVSELPNINFCNLTNKNSCGELFDLLYYKVFNWEIKLKYYIMIKYHLSV